MTPAAGSNLAVVGDPARIVQINESVSYECANGTKFAHDFNATLVNASCVLGLQYTPLSKPDAKCVDSKKQKCIS